MELVAQQLATAILEGKSPKDIFRQMQRERAAAEKAKHQEPTVHTRPCQEWDEWEHLEEWQQAAAMEIEAIEGRMAYVDATATALDVEQQSRSFTIYQDEDAAYAAAISQVEEDLDQSPEIFSQGWLRNYINTDRLRNLLSGDVMDMERERYADEWPNSEAKRDGLIEQDRLDRDEFFAEDGEELEITPELENQIDSAYESFIANSVEAVLEDPIQYLADIYGREDAAKQAIDLVGINATEAAEAAVSADGWQHFLARYDGTSNDLPGGAVYVRTN